MSLWFASKSKMRGKEEAMKMIKDAPWISLATAAKAIRLVGWNASVVISLLASALVGVKLSTEDRNRDILKVESQCFGG